MSLLNCRYHLCADGTQIYYQFNQFKVINACNITNSDSERFHSIATCHQLKINTSKSCSIIFTGDSIKSCIQKSIVIKLDEHVLPVKYIVKSQGVMLDGRMHFSCHITCVLKKAYTAVKGIYGSRKCLSVNTKRCYVIP